ncbi:MAG: precorrin-8X methylmutase [Lachnospiraceae bacterium]|nr:precorrin-8X methylmutase [Lachnospiraceae bacterium]
MKQGKWKPEEIEKKSFSIIEKECTEQGIFVPEEMKSIVFRAIHATADFDYARTLVFSDNAVEEAQKAIRSGASIVTDTNMALAGISRRTLDRLNCRAFCYMADESVASEASRRGITRASVSMERAVKISGSVIFAVGNAPTALMTLYEKIKKGYRPALVIGVPVGFVNVEEAKELILSSGIPYIVNRGRKGGSTVAAAIVNALLYEADPSRGGEYSL